MHMTTVQVLIGMIVKVELDLKSERRIMMEDVVGEEVLENQMRVIETVSEEVQLDP